MVVFLCTILHPQRSWRNSNVNRLMTEIEREETNEMVKMEGAAVQEQLDEISNEEEKMRLFLLPTKSL